MSEATPVALPEAGHDVTRFERRCLAISLTLSSVTAVAGVIGWWLVRFANQTAADEGGRVRDLFAVNWGNSPLPFLLFVIFAIGSACVVLALLGANAARSAPWKAVVAGMLGAALLMVPVVTVGNALVTAGIWDTGGD